LVKLRVIGLEVGRLPMSAMLRTEATDETQGFMKVLVGGSDDRILGFTMIGSEAGEVPAAVQTAMLANLRIGGSETPPFSFTRR
jgi:pyruvate/2-oxoglutarate dehydrogenase complex dihydrolipoamide dehydrogenase (E3) component